MQFFFGSNLAPGQGQAEYLTQEGQISWGKWFITQTAGGLVAAASVDAGNTPTTILRPGLALGVITASGKITQWNPYATDGSNALYGFYCGMSQNMSMISGTSDRWLGDIVVGGQVKSAAIIIPGESSAGISGKTYEYLLREQAKFKFLLDDDMGMYVQDGKVRELTGDLTVTKPMNRTLFVMQDSQATDCTITLPAPIPGLTYGFLNLSTTAGTEIILDGPSTGEFWVAGAAANTVTIAGDTSVPRWVRSVRDASSPTYRYVVEA